MAALRRVVVVWPEHVARDHGRERAAVLVVVASGMRILFNKEEQKESEGDDCGIDFRSGVWNIQYHFVALVTKQRAA